MDSRPNQLKCGLINIQSICNKSLELASTIEENNFDIMIIKETWLKGKEED